MSKKETPIMIAERLPPKHSPSKSCEAFVAAVFKLTTNADPYLN